MQEHLTDEQLVEQLISPLASGGNAAREHLEICAACREEVGRLRKVLAAYREDLRAVAERPESFWQAHRAALASRRSVTRALRRLAWAATAAALVVAALVVLQRPKPSPAVAQVDSDQALLVEVQRSVRRELPRALEPAALLAWEVSRSVEARSNP